MREKPFLIRRAVTPDAKEICKLVALLGYPSEPAAVKQRIGQILVSSADLLLVAVDPEKKVIGCLQAHSAAILESGFRIEIVGMVVSLESRRIGVGKALVEGALNWGKEIHAESIVVRSNINRTESHMFYTALGFKGTKTQHVYRKPIC
jgi:N-acetylglutamate synthase-like GNAT family acetyltransferase